MYLDIGTKLRCPKCSNHIATINDKKHVGESVRSTIFVDADLYKASPKNYSINENSACPKCGAYYLIIMENGTEIAGDKGWSK